MNFKEWGGTQDLPLDHAGEILVHKIPLTVDGYAMGPSGRYFGVGRPVYSIADADSCGSLLDCYIRAADREDARSIVLAQFPKAKIRR